MVHSFADAFEGQRTILAERLDVSHGLLRQLQDSSVLTNQHIQEIENLGTESSKANKLLDFLERTDPKHVPAFCESLVRTNQKYIVDDYLRLPVDTPANERNDQRRVEVSRRCGKRRRTSSAECNSEHRGNNVLPSTSDSVLSSGYCTLSDESQKQCLDQNSVDDRRVVPRSQLSSGFSSAPSFSQWGLNEQSCSLSLQRDIVSQYSDDTQSQLQNVDPLSVSMISVQLPVRDSNISDFSKSLLIKTFGPQASFRDQQQQVIDDLVIERCRMMLVEPAGWGKTFVYVAAAMGIRKFAHRVTLVATPLLALMRNQAKLARSYGAEVECLSSLSDEAQRRRIRQRIIQRDVDLVLTTPEQLFGILVADDDDQLFESIGMFAVDEAQCITQWGCDFRPDFRRLATVVKRLPSDAAVLATTATATDDISEDIRAVLGINEERCIRGELYLPNVQLQLVNVMMKGGGGMAWLVENIPRLDGTGIIYCLTIRSAETISCLLRANAIEARAYYSNVLPPRDFGGDAELINDSDAYRQQLENQFLDNRLKVLVATSALGMGFNKPDVGFVILFQPPISTATCYQQLGRAGRQIEKAIGFVVYDENSYGLQRDIIKGTLCSKNEFGEIFKLLESNRYDECNNVTVFDIERECKMSKKRIEAALKFLMTVERPPVRCLAVEGGQSSWQYAEQPNYTSYENIRLTMIKKKQADWTLMMGFCAMNGKGECLMLQLCKDLGGRLAPTYRCQICSECLRNPILPTQVNAGVLDSVVLHMKSASHTPLNLKHNLLPVGAFTLDEFSSDSFSAVKEGRIMCNWMEPGWGEVIADECYSSRRQYLTNVVVSAAAELINERWQPKPELMWITCIPSATSNMMVDFARRLASRLHLPFSQAVAINRRMQKKKDQKNTFFRCRNLDGGYKIVTDKMLDGPVLLVDYLVRSGWTLRVAAALLNQARSGPVFPLALAKIGGNDCD